MSTSLPAATDADAVEVTLVGLGADVRDLKRELDDATATPIFIEYRLAPAWAEGVDYAIEALEGHLPTNAAAVLLLTEHAVRRLENAELDDSDGWLSQFIPRLERIHAAACKRLALEPQVLADRLSALAAASELEAFHDAAETHAEALGKRGLQALLRGSGERPEGGGS